MTKSELIELLARKQSHLSYKDVENAAKVMIEQMSQSLSGGDRIEIRGFGVFIIRPRKRGIGRNPRTGDEVTVPDKMVPYFKTGKELRERLNTAD